MIKKNGEEVNITNIFGSVVKEKEVHIHPQNLQLMDLQSTFNQYSKYNILCNSVRQLLLIQN